MSISTLLFVPNCFFFKLSHFPHIETECEFDISINWPEMLLQVYLYVKVIYKFLLRNVTVRRYKNLPIDILLWTGAAVSKDITVLQIQMDYFKFFILTK